MLVVDPAGRGVLLPLPLGLPYPGELFFGEFPYHAPAEGLEPPTSSSVVRRCLSTELCGLEHHKHAEVSVRAVQAA